ncbi:hypothetical protein ABTX60_34025 [Streptomyces sp. NPDC126510]|uniref:hypothetical protein n=1 Tax=Streptomyces sp. NPDC126510 TaxID=3155317 RepID=UPI003318A1F9
MTAHHDDRTTEPTDDERTAVPGSAGERTEVLDPVGEQTAVLGRAGGETAVLGPAGEETAVLGRAGEQTAVLGPAGEQTAVLGPAGEETAVLGPAGEQAEVPGSSADGRRTLGVEGEYSATVLASHWIQRPGADETAAEQAATEKPPARPTSPDRAEGTVLRFGPGVSAAVHHRTHRTLPAVPPPPAPRERRLRRHALPALVVLCVLTFLAWQRLGPPLAVSTASVTARPTSLGCDGTADLVALVTTNGRPGTLSYRWIRSDGTASGVLKEVLAPGQRQARLHLRWTFQGTGHRAARAELRILSGAPRTVTAGFTYDCP